MCIHVMCIHVHFYETDLQTESSSASSIEEQRIGPFHEQNVMNEVCQSLALHPCCYNKSYVNV